MDFEFSKSSSRRCRPGLSKGKGSGVKEEASSLTLAQLGSETEHGSAQGMGTVPSLHAVPGGS